MEVLCHLAALMLVLQVGKISSDTVTESACEKICLAEFKSVVVSTSLGNVTGVLEHISDESVEAFRGIPYAKPPIGNLRFAYPEAYGHFHDLNAVGYKPQCVQSVQLDHSVPESEDCLYLNIFRKPHDNCTDGRTPIVVMIHGGAFAYRSTRDFSYNGAPLAAFGGVIVVTIQYRLGVFGFAQTEHIPGNLGLYDQKLALEWVQANIHYFGGDPKQITLMGVSAGAKSVAAHIISPLYHDGSTLFRAAILDAGAMSNGVCADPELTAIRVKTMAEKLGCPSIDQSEMLSCLRDVNSFTLANASFDSTFSKIRTYVPTADGVFLPKSIGDATTYHRVKMMIGTAKDEGSTTVRGSADPTLDTDEDFLNECAVMSQDSQYLLDFNDSSIRKTVANVYLSNIDNNNNKKENIKQRLEALISFVSDGSYRCPMNAFLSRYLNQSNHIFVYEFNRRLRRPYLRLNPERFGVFHWSPHIHFSGALLVLENLDPLDRQFFLDSVRMIADFIKSADDVAPAFRGLRWPNFAAGEGIMQLAEQPSITGELKGENECHEIFSYM